MPLSPGETNSRAVALLTVNQALNSAAFAMLFPLVSARFTGDLGFSATLVGLALAVRNLSQHGLTVLGGAVADQIGHKPMIVLGMAVRGIGFVAFGLAESVPALFLGALLSGLGGMLFDAPNRAALAAFTPPGSERQRGYALVNTANSLGNVLGPLVGVLLLAFHFRTVGLVSGAVFGLIALQTLWLFPSAKQSSRSQIQVKAALESIREVARDRRFVLFTAALTSYWFLYNQLFVTLPLAAISLTGDTASPGWVYALSAGVGIVLQYPMARLVSRRLNSFVAIALGLAITGLGLMAAGQAPNLTVMLVFVFVYSVGRFIVEPVQSSLVSELAPEGKVGAYIGFSILAFAVGGALGSGLGGILYDLSTHLNIPSLVWLIMGAVGVAGATSMLRLRRPASHAA